MTFDRARYMRFAADEYGRRIADGFFQKIARLNFAGLEASPIETALGCALAANVFGRHGAFISDKNLPFETLKRVSSEKLPMGCSLLYQVRVGRYFADFVLAVRHEEHGTAYFAIECDGHDFHEKTTQQAQRDKARDRHFQTAGLHIFRFTGSEIWSDPFSVADGIIESAYATMAAHRGGK